MPMSRRLVAGNLSPEVSDVKYSNGKHIIFGPDVIMVHSIRNKLRESIDRV